MVGVEPRTGRYPHALLRRREGSAGGIAFIPQRILRLLQVENSLFQNVG